MFLPSCCFSWIVLNSENGFAKSKKVAKTNTTCLRFVHIFACVAFKKIYYLGERIHFIIHNLKALPPYTKYLSAK